MQPETLSSQEGGTDLPKEGDNDITREQILERVPQPQEAMPRPEAEEEPRAGLFGGGGGRHRGFSPERLKPTSGKKREPALTVIPS